MMPWIMINALANMTVAAVIVSALIIWLRDVRNGGNGKSGGCPPAA